MRIYKVIATRIELGKGLTQRRVTDEYETEAESSTHALRLYLEGRASTDIVVSVKTKTTAFKERRAEVAPNPNSLANDRAREG